MSDSWSSGPWLTQLMKVLDEVIINLPAKSTLQDANRRAWWQLMWLEIDEVWKMDTLQWTVKSKKKKKKKKKTERCKSWMDGRARRYIEAMDRWSRSAVWMRPASGFEGWLIRHPLSPDFEETFSYFHGHWHRREGASLHLLDQWNESRFHLLVTALLTHLLKPVCGDSTTSATFNCNWDIHDPKNCCSRGLVCLLVYRVALSSLFSTSMAALWGDRSGYSSYTNCPSSSHLTMDTQWKWWVKIKMIFSSSAAGMLFHLHPHPFHFSSVRFACLRLSS